jgi:YVTN family beta-propeller protein
LTVSGPRNGNAPQGVYAFTHGGMMSPAVAGDPELVYVPNSGQTGMHGHSTSTNKDRDSVTVIDPKTFRIVGHFPVGALPQHVTPSWDLTTLWVDSMGGNELVPIDPHTAKPGTPVPVEGPYNLYFTPDGRSALVMAEGQNRVDVRDPHTMALRRRVSAPCQGINHVDFSADGSYFIATCEFSGQLVKFDSSTMDVLGVLNLGRQSMPQDIRLGPDGSTFFVADLNGGGLITVDGASFRRTGVIPTGAGAHGIYPSRDGTLLYVSNRDAGSVSVVDPAARKTVATWPIPGGGSPDMGGVSADGTQLWMSGRDNDEVYVFSTTDGHLLARIRVGANPHGLTIFPQPGRYSLGHTGNYR